MTGASAAGTASCISAWVRGSLGWRWAGNSLVPRRSGGEANLPRTPGYEARQARTSSRKPGVWLAR